MLMRFDPISEFDRLTRSLLNDGPASTGVPLDAYRRGDSFIVQMDMPGIDIDTLDVTVERNALSVAASRMTSHQEGDTPIISERPIGRFTRQLFLSDNVDAENINAEYNDGVLTLTIPVADKAKPKRIAVRRRQQPTELQST